MYKQQTLTDEEKYMLTQNQLERELTHLKREFFSLDLDKFYGKKGNKELVQTNKVLAIFVKEKQNLGIDLIRAKDPGRLRQDEETFNQLSNLLHGLDSIEADVHTHKVYMREIDDRIKKIMKSVTHLRKQQITDKQHETRILLAYKTVEALEHKLETQMIKFGTICSKNRVLREEIGHLLTERRTFMKAFDKLIKKLCAGKKIMLDLIEQATIAFNQREEWVNKLQGLRQKAHQELLQNRIEMRDNTRKHDNTTKLEEFLNTKGQKRVLRDMTAKYKEKIQRRREQLEQKLEKYNQMFNDIKEFSKEPSNIKRIAQKYLNQEDLNFSNFTWILNAIEDMDMMNDQLGPLHLEIEDQSFLLFERERKQQEKILRLEGNLEDASRDTREAEEQLQNVSGILNRLIEGVEAIFARYNFSRDPILQLLGDQSHVAHYNVLLYMNVLEDNVHRLLVAKHYKDKIIDRKGKGSVAGMETGPRILPSDKTEPRPKIYPIDKIVKTTLCALCMEHEFVSDVVDTLQEAYTRPKAKDKIKMRLKIATGPCHNISNCTLPKSRQMMQKRYT